MATEKEIQHAAVAGLLTITYEPIAQTLVHESQELGLQLPELAIKLITVGFLAMVFWAAVKVIDRLVLFAPIRKMNNRLKPPCEMEGFWYQHVSGIPERPHSISQIRFDWLNYRWIYEGAALDQDGNLAARWLAYSIYFDSESRQWFLMGNANLMTKNDNVNNYKRQEKDGSVLSILTLVENKEDAVCGVCIDYGAVIGSQGRHFNVAMTPIGKDLFRRLGDGRGGTARRIPRNFRDLSYDDLKKIVELITVG